MKRSRFIGGIIHCSKCKSEIILTESRIRNGSSYCYACSNALRTAQHYKKYQNKPGVIEKRRIRGRIYAKKYKNIRIVYRKVNKALKNGILKKLPCELCHSTHMVNGHHEDYSKPLSVVWLCTKCHANVHEGKICLLRPAVGL